LDVVEKINYVVLPNGQSSRSDVIGTVKANSRLGGMPVVELGLNERQSNEVVFDDVKFHRCVDLQKYDEKQIISFVPPDGEFELMTYIVRSKFRPLFTLSHEVLFSQGSRREHLVKLQSNFKAQSTAHDIRVFIPLPCDANSPKFTKRVGNAEYLPNKECALWKIGSVKGEETITLEFAYQLPTIPSR
jgi:AP-1 complex subunit mu